MPTIEISENQREYLEVLRDRLAAEFVGEYGYIRDRDAVQYLIDVVEDGRSPVEDVLSTNNTEDTGTPKNGEERLEAMMNLLDTHDDKWSETDAEDARYEVTLPDGETERVRTRDEVRAVLFKHYR